MRSPTMVPMVMLAVAAAVLSGAVAERSLGDIIIQHDGDSDPVDEGWIHDARPNCTVGPVTDDLGLGDNAWFTADNSTVTGSVGRYYHLLTEQQGAAARDLGWSATVRVRVTETSDDPYGAVVFYLNDGLRNWILNFGSDGSDNQLVRAQTAVGYPPGGINYTNSSGGYHLYEIVYDPQLATADILIDGVERISDWAGYAQANELVVRFGSAASLDAGRGNWSQVRFDIVPEPATVGLVLFGGLILLRQNKRKKSV